jgi:SpoVK/Ycf46/Vps4 family AAA+-type ATPase
MNTIPTSLSAQASFISAASKGTDYYSILTNMLITTILFSLANNFTLNINLPSLKYKLKEILQSIGLMKKEYQIKLVSKSFSTYGRVMNDISSEKLSVLYYLQKNLEKFKNLYKLKQNIYSKEEKIHDEFINVNKCYYNIAQSKSIQIYREGEFYISCINREYKEGVEKDERKNTTINEITLLSNKSLGFIKQFIEKCQKEREADLKRDKKRYIFTYVGQDLDKNLMYEKEEFVPYAKFSGLVGDKIKEIEGDFDFFQSEKGKTWYEKRNLPYQITHLYHGEPGAGKSIVASAIAKKYNLHIIKIKLSTIKNNNEFIRVFKNTDVCRKNLEYKDVLYLFDEIDTELEKILDRSKKRAVNINEPKSENMKVKNFIRDDLTIGTILEEMNGINQMYGRKMIFITNNFNFLESIHSGALIRPGRVDRIYKFGKCSKKDTIKLLENFYSVNLEKKQTKDIKNGAMTAAELVNICKKQKTVGNALKVLTKL